MISSEAYNMDCMEYMATLPDKAFDLAIVDPPYGISAISVEPWKQSVTNPRGVRMRNRIKQGAGKLKDRAIQQLNSDFDFSPPTEEYFAELFRVSKNQIIWGGNYFPLPPTRCVLCWDKQQPWDNFSQWEMAWTSFDKPAAIFRYRNTGGTETKHIHPTQKPVELYAWLIKTFAKEGDSIIDTHLGSGSSRIAAYHLGHAFVGCEIDINYFIAADVRFKSECLGERKLPNGMTEIQTKLFEQ